MSRSLSCEKSIEMGSVPIESKCRGSGTPSVAAEAVGRGGSVPRPVTGGSVGGVVRSVGGVMTASVPEVVDTR